MRLTKFQARWTKTEALTKPEGCNARSWEIFRQHIRGATYEQLALQFAVTRQNIFLIVSRIAESIA